MTLFNNEFTTDQTNCLIGSLISFLLSLFFYAQEKEKLSILFLIISALLLNSFAALLDPFLNIWDERFHALVAKNLISHPLKPTLYDNPVVKMAYDRWDRSYIWLHKQPLFLWQIALSFFLFGVSEFTLRIPDIIMGAILVFIGYRSGKLLVNQRVGYLTGILILTCNYCLELISGRQELEHNDVAFLFYISLSIWSFIEYEYSKKKYWIILIGVFSGFAILCKWLVGLLIYFGWFIHKILTDKFLIKKYNDIFIAFLVTLIIALPWQIYTFFSYPTDFAEALNLNSQHFLHSVEGHEASNGYYIEGIKTMYGIYYYYALIPAIIIFYSRIANKKMFYSLVAMVIITYLFFTIAVTKMPSFTLIVLMIIMILLANFVDQILEFFFMKLNLKPHISKIIFSMVAILLLFSIDLKSITSRHQITTNENDYASMMIHNKKIFKSLRLPKQTVLFNVKGRHYIEAMFYTSLPAYNFIPDIHQYNELKNKFYTIALFNSEGLVIPNYLKNDSTVIFMNEKILGYD